MARITTLDIKDLDMIIIDRKSVTSAHEVWEYLDVLQPLLSPRGVVLIPNIRPDYPHESYDTNSSFYRGDMYQV
jgi:hypothetical protein